MKRKHIWTKQKNQRVFSLKIRQTKNFTSFNKSQLHTQNMKKIGPPYFKTQCLRLSFPDFHYLHICFSQTEIRIIMWYSYLVLHILDVDFLRVFCFKLTKRKFFILYLILDKDWKKWSRKRTKKFSICGNKVNDFKCNWTMVM